MKKINPKALIVIGIIGIMVAIGVCWYVFGFAGKDKKETKLSMEKIIELSQKGDALTWGDFEQYQSIDVGSGLWIERFEIAGEPDYCLLVGGASVGRDDKPMYIRLMKIEDKRPGVIPDSEAEIDIRMEDVGEFLKEQGIQLY